MKASAHKIQPHITTQFTLDKLPQVLRDTDRWICWKYEIINGKRKKPPCNSYGRRIDATNAANYLPFAKAQAMYQTTSNLDGLGFILNGNDDLVCIDLDQCIDEAGRLGTQALLVLRDIAPTYIERSPSQHGLHAWVKAHGIGRHRFQLRGGGDVEIYGKDGYITMTGWAYGVSGLPHHPQVEVRQAQVEALIARLDSATATPLSSTLAKPTPCQHFTTTAPTSNGGGDTWQTIVLDYGPLTEDDKILISLMRKRSQKFRKLFDGNITLYNEDDSRADLALLSLLRYWTKGNTCQMCRIFTSSKLGQRDKWRQREYYAKKSIYRAIQ